MPKQALGGMHALGLRLVKEINLQNFHGQYIASYPGHSQFFNVAQEWPGYEARQYMHVHVHVYHLTYHVTVTRDLEMTTRSIASVP